MKRAREEWYDQKLFSDEETDEESNDDCSLDPQATKHMSPQA